MHACIQTPVTDSNILHIFRYMFTYESFTSNQVHNNVLSVSMNHDQFFSTGLIILIFSFFQTRSQNSSHLKIPKNSEYLFSRWKKKKKKTGKKLSKYYKLLYPAYLL